MKNFYFLVSGQTLTSVQVQKHPELEIKFVSRLGSEIVVSPAHEQEEETHEGVWIYLEQPDEHVQGTVADEMVGVDELQQISSPNHQGNKEKHLKFIVKHQNDEALLELLVSRVEDSQEGSEESSSEKMLVENDSSPPEVGLLDDIGLDDICAAIHAAPAEQSDQDENSVEGEDHSQASEHSQEQEDQVEQTDLQDQLEGEEEHSNQEDQPGAPEEEKSDTASHSGSSSSSIAPMVNLRDEIGIPLKPTLPATEHKFEDIGLDDLCAAVGINEDEENKDVERPESVDEDAMMQEAVSEHAQTDNEQEGDSPESAQQLENPQDARTNTSDPGETEFSLADPSLHSSLRHQPHQELLQVGLEVAGSEIQDELILQVQGSEKGTNRQSLACEGLSNEEQVQQGQTESVAESQSVSRIEEDQTSQRQQGEAMDIETDPNCEIPIDDLIQGSRMVGENPEDHSNREQSQGVPSQMDEEEVENHPQPQVRISSQSQQSESASSKEQADEHNSSAASQEENLQEAEVEAEAQEGSAHQSQPELVPEPEHTEPLDTQASVVSPTENQHVDEMRLTGNPVAELEVTAHPEQVVSDKQLEEHPLIHQNMASPAVEGRAEMQIETLDPPQEEPSENLSSRPEQLEQTQQAGELAIQIEDLHGEENVQLEASSTASLQEQTAKVSSQDNNDNQQSPEPEGDFTVEPDLPKPTEMPSEPEIEAQASDQEEVVQDTQSVAPNNQETADEQVGEVMLDDILPVVGTVQSEEEEPKLEDAQPADQVLTPKKSLDEHFSLGKEVMLDELLAAEMIETKHHRVYYSAKRRRQPTVEDSNRKPQDQPEQEPSGPNSEKKAGLRSSGGTPVRPTGGYHPLIYNHNSVLMDVDIEQAEIPMGYFVKISNKYRKQKAGEAPRRFKPEECCICYCKILSNLSRPETI